MRRPELTVILPIVLIGIVSTAIAVITRSNNDTAFVFRQQNLTPITAAVLGRFVASAPDPRPGMGRHRGLSGRCSTQGVGEFRNPWSCTVRYPVGRAVRYRVVIQPDGQVQGVNRDGSLTVYGCCVGYRSPQ
jgi:hypothetical protein